MKEEIFWVWLSRIENLDKRKLDKLLERYKDVSNLWNVKNSYELLQLGLTQNLSEKIVDNRYKKDLEKYIQYMRKNDIEILTFKDEDYPENLKQIYDPPISIYIKGNRKILNEKSIAIIGCRQCSKYGEDITKKFAYELGMANINIVSGLARGIDTYSHIGALRAKGKTTAVIGSGLDIVYPPENSALYQKIIENGGVILSEYIVGTKPLARNFPARNRIISGISDAVLVVEAKEKSGTLITVDFALEQGKDVYAIPGNISSESSYGTNELIKEGARLVANPRDLLKELLI